MGDDDSGVEPSEDDVIGWCLGTGIVFSFREKMERSMPVVSSLLPLFAKPLLDTTLDSVGEEKSHRESGGAMRRRENATTRP
jgi:hypothetical protein